MTQYQIMVRGEWAGDITPGWKPGIAGTLNQSTLSDDEASCFETRDEALAVAQEWIGDAAEWRVVQIG
jgi:hypothetical protein